MHEMPAQTGQTPQLRQEYFRLANCKCASKFINRGDRGGTDEKLNNSIT